MSRRPDRDLFDRLNSTSCQDLARRLGLRLSGRNKAWCPCPDQRRPALGFRPDGRGFRCHRCGASGKPCQLAALVLTGCTRPGPPGWLSVSEALQDLTCEALVSGQAPRRRTGRPRTNGPGLRSLKRFWDHLSPLSAEPAVEDWIVGRHGLLPRPHVDLALAELNDLARVIPRDFRSPRWASFRGQSWKESGYRLIFPMFDDRGRFAGLRARRLDPMVDDFPKVVLPFGSTNSGRVLADPLARQMLAGSRLGEGTDAAGYVQRVGLLIVEGEPSFLTAATWWSDACEDAMAVIGVSAGGWTQAVADRVPEGTPVLLATDHDGVGNGFAERIAESLGERCPILRWQPKPGAPHE